MILRDRSQSLGVTRDRFAMFPVALLVDQVSLRSYIGKA
jgi:hypothetical protein